MEVDLIFLPKDDQTIKSKVKQDFRNMLQLLFSNVSNDDFTVNINGIDRVIKYDHSLRSDNILFIKLGADYSEMESAKCLTKAVNSICKGAHRKEYHIIISYDEASCVYCNKLMPLFGEFERRLRELLYITCVKFFKREWFDQAISFDLQAKLKAKKDVDNKRLIENALEELTYEQLRTLLFEPFSKEDIYCLLDNELSENNINQLAASQIIYYLDSCRKRSLWNRFFETNADIKDIQFEINYLQRYRNKVMHHKTLSYDEYVEVRKRIRTVNYNLKNAIFKLESIIYKEEDYGNIALAMANLANIGKAAISGVMAISQSLAQLGKAMSTILNDSHTETLISIGKALLYAFTESSNNAIQGDSSIEQEKQLEEVDTND